MEKEAGMREEGKQGQIPFDRLTVATEEQPSHHKHYELRVKNEEGRDGEKNEEGVRGEDSTQRAKRKSTASKCIGG